MKNLFLFLSYLCFALSALCLVFWVTSYFFNKVTILNLAADRAMSGRERSGLISAGVRFFVFGALFFVVAERLA